MKARSSWLFPMMVMAAASVTAFGCIGIAAITGNLRLAPNGNAMMVIGVTEHSEQIATSQIDLSTVLIQPVQPHERVDVKAPVEAPPEAGKKLN